MLSSDYEFVDVSNVGSFIHNEILPTRFIASTSSGKKATTAYEDYLWLLEAYYERMNYDQDGQNNIQPANRVMTAADARPLYWSRPVGTLPSYGSGGYFISPNTALPTTWKQVSSSASSTDVLSGYQWTKSSQNYWPMSKATRNLENWARLFYDYKQMSLIIEYRGYFDGSSSSPSTGPVNGVLTSRRYRNDGSYNTTQSPYSWGGDYAWTYVRESSTASYHSEAIYEPSVTWKNPILYAPHAVSATMLVKLDFNSTFNGTTDVTYIVPLQLQINNGNITFPASNWHIALTQQILQMHSRPYITSFQGQSGITESGRDVVTIGDMRLLVWFDFPASFTSWNWHPS